MSLAEELAVKYGFTNQGYERSDFVAALNELQERCAKEAEATIEDDKLAEDSMSCQELSYNLRKRERAKEIAARIRSL